MHVHIANTTVSADWGRAARLIRAAGWAWLTHAGPSQAVRAVAHRGGPFHLHCPSLGSPSRGLDKGEARVLPELDAAGWEGGSENHSAIFIKAGANLWELKEIESRDKNVSITKTVYISHCLFADKSVWLFSQRFSSYLEGIMVLYAPFSELLGKYSQYSNAIFVLDRWYCLDVFWGFFVNSRLWKHGLNLVHTWCVIYCKQTQLYL